MWRFGTAVFLFLLASNLLTLHANLSQSYRLNLPGGFPALGALMLYMVWWLVAFCRAFRKPGISASSPRPIGYSIPRVGSR
jgi:hypothetical protein